MLSQGLIRENFIDGRVVRAGVSVGLLGTLLAVASVGKYFDIYQGEGPPLLFPLEFMAQRGREIAVCFLSLVAFFSLLLPKSNQYLPLPTACKALIAIQVVLLFKFVASGGERFAGIALLVYTAQWLVYSTSFSKLMGSDVQVVTSVARVFLGALAIFLCMNFYQYVIDPGPAMMSQGRFHGVTGNPQMFALCVGITFPALLYFIQSPSSKRAERWLAITLAGIAFLLIFLSGSRLAVLLLFVGAMPYLRFSLIFAVALVGLLFWLFAIDPRDFIQGNAEAIRIVRTNDSRTEVWSRQISTFFEYPLFGKPVEGERIRFGESSWFALMGTTGLVGLMPAVFFLASLVSICKHIWNSKHFAGKNDSLSKARFLVGSLMALVVGSFFEAYMLGTLSMPLLSAIVLIFGATTYVRALKNVCNGIVETQSSSEVSFVIPPTNKPVPVRKRRRGYG